MPFLVPVILATALTAATSQPSAPDSNATILGSWRGTSICVDREHYPACHDEENIYTFTASESPDTVQASVDKLVNGAWGLMAESTFARAEDGAWVSEFQTPRAHGRITLYRKGSHLGGIMIDIPTGRHIREIELEFVLPDSVEDSKDHE